jgi:hypothetical protein
MIQPVLPLHEYVEPLHYVVDSATVEEAAADPAGSGATLIETFCLSVQVWILSIT